MDAFLFTIALFMFFSVVGFGVLTLLPSRLADLQTALIAPSMGVAATILPVFALSRMGLPVQDFALLVFVALGALAVLVVAVRRPTIASDLRFAVPILLVALLLAAWPMFLYGFDWVSFANDDMANYALGAQRFLTGGFFAEPNFASFFAGKDYASIYWSMHVAGGSRAGSELMLSAVWGASGQNAHFIFMPVIFALHLSLVSATGALVASNSKLRWLPFIAMGLMAVSPMSTLGVLYQLIGQVGGLTLLCSAIVLAFRPLHISSNFSFIVANVPAGLVFSALVVWYPELLPFFGLGWLIYVGAKMVNNVAEAIRAIIAAAVVGTVVIVLMNAYLIEAALFMLNQTVGGMQAADPSEALFPYFLVPSGIAALLGLIPIGNQVGEPWLSFYILTGAVIIGWLFLSILPRRARNIGPAEGVLLAMSAVGSFLFFRNNDFGLFKLVMFIQPFLLAVFARELIEWKSAPRVLARRNVLAAVAAVVLAGPIFATQNGYVAKSTGELYGGLSEVPHASSAKISRQFAEFVDGLPRDAIYFADTTNIVLAKFQALHARGTSLIFPSRNFFINFLDMMFLDAGADGQEAVLARYESAESEYLTRHEITIGGVTNSFVVPGDLSGILRAGSMITTTENQTIINGMSDREGDLYFELLSNPQNRLIFIHSELGNHYYFGLRDRISFYSLEQDPMFSGQLFSALGQHLLFLVHNPTVNARLRMELSDTVLKQYDSTLPNAKAQGAPVGFIGRGSGRVYSPPLTPTQIDSSAYIAIDLDRVPTPIELPIYGLMNLYGRDIPQDSRRIAAFGRDISLISEAEYRAMTPPVSLSTFPADLQDINLEYSGIYEDGWISERAFFTLAPTSESRFLVLRGAVPMIGDEAHTSSVTVSIDGAVVAEQALGLGVYEIKVPISDVGAKMRIDLAFENPQTLPNGDGRITAGQLSFLGFVEE